MALIAMPAGGLRSVDWTLPDHAGFVVRNQWSGAQTVGDLGGIRAGWKAKVTIVPQSSADILAWRVWMASMLGAVNTFELDATEGSQAAAPTPVLGFISTNPPAFDAITSTAVDGLNLAAGSLCDMAGRLYVLTGTIFGIGGTASYSVFPRLAAVPAASAAIRIQHPVGTMRLTNPALGWSVAPGRLYTPFGFDAEEAL